jgi:hypothetical protein
MRINLLNERKASVWSRLVWKARRDRKARGPMWQMYEAMRAEQRAEGIARGVVMCDVPWCPCGATHAWVRTLAEIRASRVKVRKSVQEMAPESIRCETHVPDWRVDVYRPLTGVARVSVAA